MNNPLHPSDHLFATVTQFGRVVQTLSFSGISETSEALSAVTSSIVGLTGLVKIVLRNRTVGWVEQYNYRLSRA